MRDIRVFCKERKTRQGEYILKYKQKLRESVFQDWRKVTVREMGTR